MSIRSKDIIQVDGETYIKLSVVKAGAQNWDMPLVPIIGLTLNVFLIGGSPDGN